MLLTGPELIHPCAESNVCCDSRGTELMHLVGLSRRESVGRLAKSQHLDGSQNAVRRQ